MQSIFTANFSDPFLMISHDPQTKAIINTNFWETDQCRKGFLHLHYNARQFNLLLPPIWEKNLPDMRSSKYTVISRGAYLGLGKFDFFEIMFEDDSSNPFCFHVSPQQLNIIPNQDFVEQKFTIRIYTKGDTTEPKLTIEMPCYFRMVETLPCLKQYQVSNQK